MSTADTMVSLLRTRRPALIEDWIKELTSGSGQAIEGYDREKLVHRQLNDEDAALFQSELLGEVHRWEPCGVVLDLCAVRVIDSFMSRILGQIATSCLVMGAKPVYCGITTAVAVTLVEMGRDLRGVETAPSLETALARLGMKLVTKRGNPFPEAS